MMKIPEQFAELSKMKIPEQFAELSKTSIETALRFAKIYIDSTERLTKLQMDTFRNFVDESAKNAKATTEGKDLQDIMTLRAKLAESSIQNAVSLSQGVYEVVSQTQQELTQLCEERMATFGSGLSGALEKGGKSLPPGSDFALAAMKSTMAATSAAFENMTKAAKQVAEFADAGIKTATAATTDAVKTMAKGPRK